MPMVGAAPELSPVCTTQVCLVCGLAAIRYLFPSSRCCNSASCTSTLKPPTLSFLALHPFKRTSHCHNDLQSSTKGQSWREVNTSWQPSLHETGQASCRPILLPSLAWYALMLLLQRRGANIVNRPGLLSQYAQLLRVHHKPC